MATMHDVARRAGVSVSTVSYVLTGTRPISQATRDKVLAAMAELDYQPERDGPGSGQPAQPDPRPAAADGRARPRRHRDRLRHRRRRRGQRRRLPPGALAGRWRQDLDGLRRLASQRMLDGVC